MRFEVDCWSGSVALKDWARSAICLVRLSSSFHQFECIRSQFVMFQGIVDIVVIEGLLMKRDIDETGHVMIGHEVGPLTQMQVDHSTSQKHFDVVPNCFCFNVVIDELVDIFGKSLSTILVARTSASYRLSLRVSGVLYEDFAFQIDYMQLKKGGHENIPYPRMHGIVRRLKFVKIGEDFQEYGLPIPETMLTEGINEKAARQVHATYERIVTESNPEPARRRPSGISFRDTSGVSKKTSLIVNKLKGSSEGTSVSLGVPNESIVIPATSSEGIGTKPRVPDEEKEEYVYDDDEETDHELYMVLEHVNNNKGRRVTEAEVAEFEKGMKKFADPTKAKCL
ncbi:hypothetical protein Tco_0512491 [Tanacetum coccineum]